MRLTKTQLREIIREEILQEFFKRRKPGEFWEPKPNKVCAKNPDGKTRCWTGGNADILAQAWAKGGESGLEKAHDELKQKFAKFKK